MDDEIKELAALALRNAFWYDFSALVNNYLAASEGVDVTRDQEQMLCDTANVYDRDTSAEDSETRPIIWTQNGEGRFSTTGHDTMLEALEFDRATEVHLQGKKIFERRNGEWYFVAQYGESQNGPS